MKKLILVVAIATSILLSSCAFAASRTANFGSQDFYGAWSANIGPSIVNPLDLGSVADWKVSYTGSINFTDGVLYSHDVYNGKPGYGPVWDYQYSSDKNVWTSLGSLFNYVDGDTLISTTGSGGPIVVNARYFRIVGKMGAVALDDQIINTGSATTTLVVQAVPEPGSIIALMTGIVGLAGFKLRRK